MKLVLAVVVGLILAVSAGAQCPSGALNCSCSGWGQCMWQTHPTVQGALYDTTQWEMNGLGGEGEGKAYVLQLHNAQTGGQDYIFLQGIGNRGLNYYNHNSGADFMAKTDGLDVVSTSTPTIPADGLWEEGPTIDDGEAFYNDWYPVGCTMYCGL